LSAHPFDRFAHNRQANARAGHGLSGGQSLEDFENALVMLRGNPRTVVPHF
jgi:hypothetical protein